MKKYFNTFRRAAEKILETLLRIRRRLSIEIRVGIKPWREAVGILLPLAAMTSKVVVDICLSLQRDDYVMLVCYSHNPLPLLI